MDLNNIRVLKDCPMDSLPPFQTGRIAMTVQDAMRMSGLGKTTIYSLINSGDLPRIKIGSRTLIRQDDLDRVLRSDRTQSYDT